MSRHPIQDRRHQRRHHGSDEPVRITTAPQSAGEEISGRQRRYVLSMLFRTACFIGAVLVGHGVLMWLLMIGAVFLPYVAVVMANAVNRRDDGFSLQGGIGEYRELSPGEDEERREL